MYTSKKHETIWLHPQLHLQAVNAQDQSERLERTQQLVTDPDCNGRRILTNEN